MIKVVSQFHEPELEFQRAKDIAELVKTPRSCWVSPVPRIRCSHYADAVVGVPPSKGHQTRLITEDGRLASDAEIMNPENRNLDLPEKLDSVEWKRKLDLARHITHGFIFMHPWACAYHHFFVDLLPRLAAYFEIEPFIPDLPVITGNTFGSFTLEALQFFGLGQRIIIIPWEAAVRGDSIFAASTPATMPGEITEVYLRFLKNMRSRIEPSSTPKPKRLYISRRCSLHCSGQDRVMVNEEELVRKLEERGFVEIILETLPFGEKLQLFSEADYVCGPFGAGLINSAVMRPGAKAVIFDHVVFDGKWYEELVKKMGVQCRRVKAGIPEDGYHKHATPHKAWRIDVDAACREIDAFDE